MKDIARQCGTSVSTVSRVLNNAPVRSVFKPSITTINLATYEMGFLAARWLRDNIMHRESRGNA